MRQARSHARRSATQALYQWQVARPNLVDIEQQFAEEFRRLKALQKRQAAGEQLSEADVQALDELLEKHGSSDMQFSYFSELLHGVAGRLDIIDGTLAEFVDRPVKEIDPIERAILRIGVYELLYRKDVPYKVILNEGINLAKSFGATQSHRYINGILDKIARKQRPEEVSAGLKNG
jgi:N utilization substance protein B